MGQPSKKEEIRRALDELQAAVDATVDGAEEEQERVRQALARLRELLGE